MTTNYTDTFITASCDSKAAAGMVPTKRGSIAELQYRLLAERPYALTSDDLLFEVHGIRNGITEADRASERAAFFAKPKACLRASPLVKQFGWGLHHDAEGKVAAWGAETEDYRRLAVDETLKRVHGMRTSRAG